MSDGPSTPVGRLCFDVTDIVCYARGNLRVSGIQRVQLNLITHVARNHPGTKVLCTFFHPTLRRMVTFHPLEVLSVNEFDPASFLKRLGIENKSAWLVNKQEMKRYLSKFSDNKLLRSLKKLELYFYAIFFRRHLQKLGFKQQTLSLSPAIEPVQLEDAKLLKEDSYVILGANWPLREVISFCKAHAARGGDTVQMVYDLIPQVRPEYFSSGLRRDFKNWLADVSSYVNRYICISEHTAQDLRNFLGNSAADRSIKAIPLAHEFDGYARNSPPIQPLGMEIMQVLQRPFVLCVGTIEVRKNGISLLRAWARLIERLGARTPQLVFAGKRGWLVKDFEQMRQQLSPFVQIIDSPTDADLAVLYQNCLFTAYPSLYEGWGLPVGEAAWFGKTCITSNTTSLPEVCGDLAIYVDPTDIDDIVSKMEDAICHPETITIKENAIKRSKLRTWSNVADEIFEFVREVTNLNQPVHSEEKLSQVQIG